MDDDCNHLWRYIGSKYQAAWVCSHCQALRTSEPPARGWKGLTEAEIGELYKGGWANNLDFARAIEAKLKEKNT